MAPPRTRQSTLNFNPLNSSSSPALPSSVSAMAGQKRKRLTRKQTKLDFSAGGSARSSSPHLPSPVSLVTGRKKDVDEVSSSSSSSAEEVVASAQVNETPSRRLRSSQSTPFKQLQRSRGRKVPSEDSSSSDDAADQPSATKMRKLLSLEDSGESDNSANARLESSPTKKRRVASTSAARKPPSRKMTANQSLNGFIVSSSSSSDSGSVGDVGAVRKTIKKRGNTRSPTSSISEQSGEDNEEDVPPAKPTPRKRLRNKRQIRVASDEEESDEETAPTRLSARKPRVATEDASEAVSEQEELQQELEDLRDLSSSPPAASSTRNKARDARKASLANLLKARKANKSHDREPASEESESEEESENEDSEDEATFQDHIVETAADQDFIAEDDPADTAASRLGVPAGLPLKFSHYASAKPGKLFQHVVEWMLLRDILPDYEGTELQLFAFDRIGDALAGIARSYISSAWTQEFTFALRARPEMEERDLDAVEKMMHDKCEACNRTNHPASFSMQFSKRAYDPKTLVEVEHKNRDNSGRKIAPASRIFYLGRECANNARNAHPLVHWSYILYDHINEQWDAKREELKIGKHWGAEKKVRRVQEFVERMVEQGEVKRLERGWKRDVDVAREFKAEDW